MTASARLETWHGVAAAVLTSGDTEVVVVPELGMLVAAFVVDGFDHVARPGGVGAVRGGHTTAVPLLYPWANRLSRRSYTAAGATVSLRGLPLHEDGNGLPMHGTMIGRPEWSVTALGRGRIEARHEVAASSDRFGAFPFPHTLRIAVRVGRRRVRVDTVVDASGGVAVPVSFGWHPYWRVPGAATTGRWDSPTSPTPGSTGAVCRPAGRASSPRPPDRCGGRRSTICSRSPGTAPPNCAAAAADCASRSTPAIRSSRCTRPTRRDSAVWSR